MLQKTHSLAGLLAAESVVLYFNEPLFSWESAALLMIGCLAGPLADIDKPGSTVARIFFPVSSLLRILKIRHRTLTHSLLCLVGLYLLLSQFPQTVLWASLLAYASHSFLDLFNEQGVALLWPLPTKFRLIPKFLAVRTGSMTERLIQVLLLISIAALPILVR